MKRLLLSTFSLLLVAKTSQSQITTNPVHPTQIAVEKWLNEQNQQRESRSAIEICLVTVDPNSTHNIIYWDKTSLMDVDYFKIYRENASGGYDSIGIRPYDSLSEYHDFAFTVHPNYGSSRYKISAVDTLGLEGPLSLYHQTIFCDEPVEGDFDWTDYLIEGTPNPVTDFVLLRKDTIGAAWLPIDTVPVLTTSFTDVNHALFPAGEWKVRTLWPISCTSTRAGISTSRSNLRNKSMLVKVPSIVAAENTVLIYPNPSSENITVSLGDLYQNVKMINLRDTRGRLIESKSPMASTVQFNLSNIEQGVYFVEVVSTSGKFAQKVIKQ